MEQRAKETAYSVALLHIPIFKYEVDEKRIYYLPGIDLGTCSTAID